MAKFLIGLLVGVILTVALAVIGVFSLARFGTEKRTIVPDNATLILRLEGEIPERPPIELPIPFFEQQSASTVKDVWELLRKAAVDTRIKAVVFEPRGISAGWAKLEEIRGDLEQFRKSGKPLVAYLKGPGTREYYLATACDRIYMGPEEYLDVKGLRAEMMFFRGTLDKLGVQIEVEHVGKYKDFGDMFERKDMSPETKEVTNTILDDVYGRLLSTIATARKKSVEEIRATIDEGPFLAQPSVSKGLIDSLRYEDQMFGELKDRLKSGEIHKLSHRDYLKVSPASLGLEGKPRIAFLVGQGDITRGSSSDDIYGEEGIGAEGFDKLLRRVGSDSSIRAVIVRIDSPGGDAMASDDIWREMNLLSKKKPMVISMSDAAASGGYYMAMTGDPIVAYPGTFTGSIGVVFGKPNLHGLFDKLGVTEDSLQRGRFADIDSEYQPLSPPAREKLREGIDVSYRDFVSKVAEARKRPYNQVEPLAQGRVWLGDQAKERGLVDEMGGIDRAIELVKERAKIAKDEKVALVTYPPKRSILEILMGRTPESALETRLTPLARIARNAHLKLLSQPGLLRLMPYTIEVR
jgi:protease IV